MRPKHLVHEDNGAENTLAYGASATVKFFAELSASAAVKDCGILLMTLYDDTFRFFAVADKSQTHSQQILRSGLGQGCLSYIRLTQNILSTLELGHPYPHKGSCTLAKLLRENVSDSSMRQSHRNLIYVECSLGVSSHFGC